jgi:hypothetical protein
MFTLAPATRWGYFVYPIGLVGWMFLSRPPSPGAPENGGPGTGSPGKGSTVSVGVPAQAGSQA